jgi:hypothetical protein
MVDLNIALTTAGEALKIVNQLWGVQKAFNEAERKLKVAELNGALATLKNAIVDAKEELKNKEDEVAALKKSFAVFNETVEAYGYQFDKKSDGTPTGHAYCPVCIQKEGRMFHLTTTWRPGRPEECPNCKAHYSVTHYT